MRTLNGVVAMLATLAAVPSAVQLHRGGPVVIYGDTHFHNIAGLGLTSSHSVSQPGAYELLRMPKETSRPALIELRGFFITTSNGVCSGLHMVNASLSGEWLNGKVLHMRWQDGFKIKMSSFQPRFAGPWRTIEDYSLTDNEMEAIPDTIKITKTAEGEALKFYIGPKQIHTRPTMLLTQGPHDGLDLFLSNVAKLDLPEPSNLLGADIHDEARTSQCEAMSNPQYMVMGDKHIWNLASEGFDREPGDLPLLRMPKEMERPALIHVRGSFAAATDAPCGVRMTGVAFTGEWVGNKSVHVRFDSGFLVKVSSTQPAFAGTWKSLESFDGADAGEEKLPATMKITKLEDDSAFRFHIGPKQLHKRPTILVSKSPTNDLDISMFYMKRFDAAESSSMLVTETSAARRVECEANKINVGKSYAQRMPALQELSQLTAPWLLRPIM